LGKFNLFLAVVGVVAVGNANVLAIGDVVVLVSVIGDVVIVLVYVVIEVGVVSVVIGVGVDVTVRLWCYEF
jgi:hypothetical protein